MHVEECSQCLWVMLANLIRITSHYFPVLGVFKLELVLHYTGTGVPPHTRCVPVRKMKAV